MSTADPASLIDQSTPQSAPETVDSAALSLLSLSMAASAAKPVPVSSSSQPEKSDSLLFGNGSVDSVNSSVGGGSYSGSNGGVSMGNGSYKHHRRLSSTGQTRRRLSDARDAAARPSPASAAALSLSTLSLSSPPHSHVSLPSTSLTAASNTLASGSSAPVNGIPIATNVATNGLPASVDGYKPSLPGAVKPIAISKNGKKRGMDHKCESCSKVYRHPSCLIKHRWEHTPHWRESSKYVLSKHQQVQLLEAAAILSHFSQDSATGTSLPEDRSLWPSFLSGGTLPLPEGASYQPPSSVSSGSIPARPSSSSVPATSLMRSMSSPANNPDLTSRAMSSGPRLHDYSVSPSDVTQVRPGLIVANGTARSSPAPSHTPPIPVPRDSSTGVEVSGYGFGYGNRPSGKSRSFRAESVEHGISPYSRRSKSGGAVQLSSSYGTGTSVSIPRSSLRSGSVMSSDRRSSSGSGSGGRSGSSSLEEDEEIEDEEEYLGREGDIEVDIEDDSDTKMNVPKYPYEYDIHANVGKVNNMRSMKEEEEDWEMDMEMD
ncbi:transcription factor c2h2 [Moniliophthora roreri MCA 2997]|uniref:Transcription factor c2h2 n=1 Tax=Moniliophthora roreri (strain MCA 2997) TaxID=1381753 RepID=V2WPA5_MONRO|nr:transcription factor c2h2 [Moniliophthora roreri MCA 2997]